MTDPTPDSPESLRTAADAAGRPRTRRRPWAAQHGLRPAMLALAFLALAAAPLALSALAYPLAPRSWWDDAASGLGIAAFAALLLAFALSGRYERITGRLGVDWTLRLHRWLAYAILPATALHPFLYTDPDSGGPWFAGADPTLPVGLLSLVTGMGAYILLAAMVITALDRDTLPVRYETWRRLHAVGALMLAGLIALHAFTASGYSAHPAVAAFWGVLLVAAAASLIGVHVVRPWRQWRAPYVVETVDKVGADTWELRLRPRAGRGTHSALTFRPGQFVWLKLGGGPFGADDHPFSIATAPEDAPTIGFTIREKGDFTKAIGRCRPGTPAYLDGPHGHFVPDEAEVPTVYIAGGVGIGPVLGHLRTFRAEGDNRPITLIYASASPAEIAERAELDALAGELNLTIHYVVRAPDAAWRGRTGRITRDLLDATLPVQGRADCRYFVCGGETLEAAVYRDLRALGIPARRIVVGS